jgi:hypothetical protein
MNCMDAAGDFTPATLDARIARGFVVSEAVVGALRKSRNSGMT